MGFIIEVKKCTLITTVVSEGFLLNQKKSRCYQKFFKIQKTKKKKTWHQSTIQDRVVLIYRQFWKKFFLFFFWANQTKRNNLLFQFAPTPSFVSLTNAQEILFFPNNTLQVCSSVAKVVLPSLRRPFFFNEKWKTRKENEEEKTQKTDDRKFLKVKEKKTFKQHGWTTKSIFAVFFLSVFGQKVPLILVVKKKALVKSFFLTFFK